LEWRTNFHYVYGAATDLIFGGGAGSSDETASIVSEGSQEETIRQLCQLWVFLYALNEIIGEDDALTMVFAWKQKFLTVEPTKHSEHGF